MRGWAEPWQGAARVEPCSEQPKEMVTWATSQHWYHHSKPFLNNLSNRLSTYVVSVNITYFSSLTAHREQHVEQT